MVFLVYALGCAADKKKPSTPKQSSPNKQSSPDKKPQILTNKDIDGFLCWGIDEDGFNMEFRASFTQRESYDENGKCQKSGNIPIFILAALYRYKRIMGSKVKENVFGTGHFYILDPEGKVVMRKSLA